MDYQTSFIRPSEELGIGALSDFYNKACEAGVAAALATGIITQRKEAKVREADIVADFGCGVGGWLTMPLNVAGTNYSVFATVVPAALTPTVLVTQVVVFYKVCVETPAFNIDQLSFRQGVGAGTTKAVFWLEALTTKLMPEGFLSEPVIYLKQQIMNVVVRCRIVTTARERVSLGCLIVEPAGQTISA